jgi:small GTP-binding protein
VIQRVLTRAQEELLKEERRLLGDLRVALAQFGATPESQSALEQSIHQLDELFLLVVVGEFNAGKSAFVNALLGQMVLKEGVTPTTTQVNLLRYGDTEGRRVVEEHLHVLTSPNDFLREIHIVDTPGTNAIIREHERITTDFVPRSDLVLFITSSDRPFTESERAFLQQIRDWGKKVVIVINKVDILDRDEEIAEVERFVAGHARVLLGTTPQVFPVSARLAFRAKQGEPDLWARSRFEPLERYIHDTLDQTQRLQLKLLNPLGVGAHLVESHLAATDERLSLLQDDVVMLDDVERQLQLYQSDMLRNFGFRMSDIERILIEMESRGHAYFDETMRLARVFDLINKSRIQREFEHQVVGEAPQQIERKVGELIDWLVDSDFRQWQAVTNHLAERRREHRQRIVGDDIGSFHYDRERLIDSVGRQAQRVVETYDKSEEARKIAEGARASVAASAAIEVGALSLGAVVTVAATTVAADVTGIIMAGVVAAIGFFIIPAKRRRAKQEMHEKVTDLRDGLATALRAQFESEIGRSLQRINDSIAPYVRFVRSEREKLIQTRETLERLRERVGRLRERIEAL